jgi:uncharacterized protein
MRFNPYFRGLALVILALFLLGSAASCAEGVQRLPVRELSILRTDGSSVKLSAEIADDDAERSLGLMHRKRIADGEGMLFVFESDRLLSFWMKNTLVPLSIAYIASDGRILEFHDMTPLSLAPVDSERSARYALEVKQGWFERSGVRIGDRLILPEK